MQLDGPATSAVVSWMFAWRLVAIATLKRSHHSESCSQLSAVLSYGVSEELRTRKPEEPLRST